MTITMPEYDLDALLDLASDPDTDAATLFALAHHDDDAVRMALTENASLPDEACLVLARDESEVVREYLASSGPCTPEAARILASDASTTVRESIAYNADLPNDCLQALLNDPSDWVAEAARELAAQCTGVAPLSA